MYCVHCNKAFYHDGFFSLPRSNFCFPPSPWPESPLDNRPGSHHRYTATSYSRHCNFPPVNLSLTSAFPNELLTTSSQLASLLAQRLITALSERFSSVGLFHLAPVARLAREALPQRDAPPLLEPPQRRLRFVSWAALPPRHDVTPSPSRCSDRQRIWRYHRPASASFCTPSHPASSFGTRLEISNCDRRLFGDAAALYQPRLRIGRRWRSPIPSREP